MTVPPVKVLDLSTHFSGSMATRILAHLGADVVKIENPTHGDGNRTGPPVIDGESGIHLALNPGKRSVALDWKSETWQEDLAALVSWADVVVYGGLAEAARRRGLDFESMAERNPQIVYCLITGYGPVGPWADLPSHGLNTDVYAGAVPLEDVDGYPTPRADYRSAGTSLAGIYAAIGILEGLRRRDAGDGPQNVSVSVWQSAMAWQWRDLVSLANIDRPMDSYASLGSRYSTYSTADGRAILVCPIERKYWEAFCDDVGLPAQHRDKGVWESAGGLDFGKDDEDERRVIADVLVTQPLDVWVTRFERAGVPFSPVLTTDEAMRSEQAEATRVLATTVVNGQEISVPSIPIGLSGPGDPPEAALPPATLPPPPGLGEHNDWVRGLR